MHRLRLLAFLTTFISTASIGGTVPLPSDVSVTLSAAPTDNLLPSEPIGFTMAVTNNGPAALQAFSIVGPQISNQFYYPTTSWNDCDLVTITGDGADGSFWIPEWNPTGAVGENPIAPGETRTCHFMLAVAPGLPVAYSFAVRLGTLWTDPDASNNIATVLIQRTIDVVPLLSLPALLALGLMFAICGRVFQPHQFD
jgi:hypothetical protein